LLHLHLDDRVLGVLLSLPCAIALLVFAHPLVAVLYHYGAFTDHDVRQTALALMGWGAGLLGVVAVKVLAPGFYASQDIRTPVKIAVIVLVLTQLMNLAFVPLFQHAGLSLSIGLGAMINALWLLLGLRQRGSYIPAPGWTRFLLQVLVASALLGVFLWWTAHAVPWLDLRNQPLLRVGYLMAVLAGAALIYFGSVTAAGMKLAQLVRR
ncbi:MAG: murein biosynthesis integral membrane protein MurJ, partial [Hylemonella sp.]